MPTSEYACYTSVFGDFERIWAPLNQKPTLESSVVTERPSPVKGWVTVTKDLEEYASPRLANRHQKMLFHETLRPDGFSVYIDANVRPIANLEELFVRFRNSGADLGMYRHYGRSSVHAEADACIKRNKVDNPDDVRHELAHYDEAGFPDASGMWEGSVIFKNHSAPRLSAAMHEWWDLYSIYQTRDQFSLPFVIWKHGLTVYDLDTETPGREHYFVRLQHSSRGPLHTMARYLQARAPENTFWSWLHSLAGSLSSLTRS